MVIIVGASIINSASLQSAWSILGQFQLFMLLPLTKVYLPKDLIDYCIGMQYTMFSMNFISLYNMFGISEIQKYFNIDQPNSYLANLNMNSGSTVSNLISLFMFLLVNIVFHFLLYFVMKCLMKWEKN